MSDSFATPCTVAYQAPLSMGFPKQEYWNWLPFPSPEELANPETEPVSPTLAGRFFTIWATRKAHSLCQAHTFSDPSRSFSLFLELKVKVKSLSHVWLFATPWTIAYQAPQSMGFSRQEYWSGLPFPSPVHQSEKWKWSRSVVSDSSRPHGLPQMLNGKGKKVRD